MSQQFYDANRDQLYHLYRLVTFRQIGSDDLDYLISWVNTDKWSANAMDIITWLEKMPRRDANSLDEIVAVEAMNERRMYE